MPIISVKDLSSRGSQCGVIVRLSRIWENRDQTQRMYELGFAFIDQQGCMIEGCLPENRIDQFRETLREGSVYRLESFMVTGARNRYRVIDHSCRIKFTRSTRVTELNPEPENFPLLAHSAKPFEVLESRTGNNVILSDVIGVVTEITGLLAPKPNQEPRRQIYLQNTSERTAIVTLWGEHAEKFDAEYLQEESSQDNMIVLFMGMTVTQFSRMLAFKSTSLTCWHFNPPIPEVDSFRQSLEGQHFVIGWHGYGAAAEEPAETTLYALSNEPADSIVAKKYKLDIEIIEVKNPHDWWFPSCKDCWKKMQPNGNSYKCSGCQCTQERHRYKLLVNAIDIEPNNENKRVIGQFMFFGDHGTILTGKDAVLLAATTKGRPDYIPPAIANTVGKKCSVIAEVKQDTLDADDGIIIFNVSKAQLISSSSQSEAPLTNTSSSGTSGPSAAINSPKGADRHPEEDKNSQATPTRDIIEPHDAYTREDTTSTSDGKKRKSIATGARSAKKSSADEKEGPLKELFPGKQKS